MIPAWFRSAGPFFVGRKIAVRQVGALETIPHISLTHLHYIPILKAAAAPRKNHNPIPALTRTF
jgi:hypothetical protein